MKRKPFLLFAIFSLTQFYVQAQRKEVFTIKDTAYKYKYLFDNAYNEIKQMLDGKIPISFKKAIFLTENAFHEGQLDEKWYNKKIDTIERQCREMIAAKGLQGKSTSGNWAIFGYMKQPIPYNNNQTCTYDIENFTSKNPQSQFVYSLLKTKKGTCHSLPLLYLLLAQDLKAGAYLVSAPMHLFIKHKDQYGEWWNLELTGGGYSRTSFIVESFQITDKQMESGFYMKAWNAKQTLAYFLEDLNNYYEDKTGIYYDNFTLKVAELGLKYLPASGHLLAKSEVIKYKLDKDMGRFGIHDYSRITPYPNLVKERQNYLSLKTQIAATGYKPVSEEWYRGMVKKAFETKTVTTK